MKSTSSSVIEFHNLLEYERISKQSLCLSDEEYRTDAFGVRDTTSTTSIHSSRLLLVVCACFSSGTCRKLCVSESATVRSRIFVLSSLLPPSPINPHNFNNTVRES